MGLAAEGEADQLVRAPLLAEEVGEAAVKEAVLQAEDRLGRRAGEGLAEDPRGAEDPAAGVEDHLAGERRGHLLAAGQVVLEVVVELAGGQLDDALIGVFEADVAGDHERACADQGADPAATVEHLGDGLRGRVLGELDVAADLAVAPRVDDDLAERSVAAKGDPDPLVVVLGQGAEQAAGGQGPAEDDRLRADELMALAGLADHVGGDRGEGPEALVSADRALEDSHGASVPRGLGGGSVDRRELDR